MRYKSTYGTRTSGRRSLNENRALLTEGDFASSPHMQKLKKVVPSGPTGTMSAEEIEKTIDKMVRSMDLFLTFLARIQNAEFTVDGEPKDLQQFVIEQMFAMMSKDEKLQGVTQAMSQKTVAKATKAGRTFKGQGSGDMVSNEETEMEEHFNHDRRMVESRRPTLNRKPTRRYL